MKARRLHMGGVGRAVALVVAALLVAGSASGEELRLGANLVLQYNSNINNEQSDPDPAFSILSGPTVGISDRHGRFTYDVGYTLNFEYVTNQTSINDFLNTLAVGAAYAIGPRTQVTFFDSFRDVSSVRFSREEIDDNTDQIDPERDEFQRNALNWDLEHQFTRRFFGNVRGGHDVVLFKDNSDRGDSQSFNLESELGYAVSKADRVGFGGGFYYQTFDGFSGQPGARAQSYQSFLAWTHRFETGWAMSLRGGPSFVIQQRSSSVETLDAPLQQNTSGGIGFFRFSECAPPTSTAPPQLVGVLLESDCAANGATLVAPPAGFSQSVLKLPLTGVTIGDTDTTYFGAATLSRRWEEWEVLLSYRRTQATAAGDSAASSLDRVQIAASWNPQSRWSADGSIGWSRRERFTGPLAVEYAIVPSDATVNAIAVRSTAIGVRGQRRTENNQFTVVTDLRRRLTRQLTGALQLRYNFLDRQQGSGGAATHIFIAALRLDYDLDVIRF